MSTPNSENPTALIVDDTELMRQVLRAVLEQLEYEVVGEAANGRDGVDMAIELEPDLILLDVMMPEMNGLLALQEMTGRMHEPFVVMLSSVDDDEVVKECMLVGAQGYIQKGRDGGNMAERLAGYRLDVMKKRRR